MLDGDDPHRHDAAGVPMTETLYPIGYGTQLVEIDTLRARHTPHMHPEFSRRLFAWVAAGGGLIDIGGGYRPLGAQPDKPGFAPEGMSFHQPQPFVRHTSTYAAVDLVVRSSDGGAHRAPRWSEVPAARSAEARRRGLHCHITSEPWHIQPIEIRGYTTWRGGGRLDPVANYPLPGSTATPRVFAPSPTQRRRLLGNNTREVARLQHLCNWWGWRDDHNRPLLADGKFGALTEQAVKTMQRALRTTADGVYGPITCGATQRFLDAMATVAA